MSAQSYLDDQLMFQLSPTILESIQGFKNHRHIPAQSAPYTSGKEVVIEWTHSQLMDAKNSFIAFDVVTSDASGANINNAIDFFERIKFEINSTPVDEFTRNANDWNNIIMAYSANDSYAEREANALFGYVSPHLRRSGANNTSSFTSTWLSTTARRFVVPLPLLLSIFRCRNYLPVMNQKYRLTLTFGTELKVLSHRVNTATTYSVSNLYLFERRVDLTPAYWSAMWNAMTGEQGLRIPYTSIDPQVYTADGGSTERIRLTHNFGNLASILVARNDIASKTAEASKHTAYCQSYPLTELSKFQVKINGVNMLVDDGLNGFAENYVETKKVFGMLNDLGGVGIIDYKAYSSGYTKNTDLTAGTYGMCVLGCDLQKVVAGDDVPLNAGVSADNGNIVEVELQVSTPLVAGDDELLVGLVHQRAVVMKRGSVQIIM